MQACNRPKEQTGRVGRFDGLKAGTAVTRYAALAYRTGNSDVLLPKTATASLKLFGL